MNNKLNAVVVVSLLALAESAMAQSAGQCADLTRFQIPGTPLVITGAEIVPATDNLPSHCRVDGMINERTGADGRTYGIGFGLALPEDWNGRFLFQGGGGYNGMVRPPRGVAAVGDRLGLARGFAVATTDSGHKGDVFDTSFNVDQQASLDFAQIAVARVTELAKQIVAHHYGESASYSYFTGCSTGGREAMLMTQRYPTFFDGVVSGNPAMRTSVSRLGNLWRRTVFNAAAPKDPDGRPEPHKLFSESDRQLLLDGVLAACDANDGLEDEMIFDTRSCNFDPAELACEGAKTDSCLAPAQVDAIRKRIEPLRYPDLPLCQVTEIKHPQTARVVGMAVDTASIQARLEGLHDLPTPVRAWLVKAGLDATDDRAVWICALIEQSDADADTLRRLKEKARDVVRDGTGLWVYVLVRGADEAEVTA